MRDNHDQEMLRAIKKIQRALEGINEKMPNQNVSVTKTIEETCERICDSFCKYAGTGNEDGICEYCAAGNDCPLDSLL